MSLSEFVDDVREREKTLTVFTAGDDEQLLTELEEFFGVQNITVRRGHVERGGPQNFVVLHQEGDAVAVSTLQDIRDSLFLGGTSSPFSGRMTLDAETPDVINSLGNTTFSATSDDRMLLVQIAHYIQELAFQAGEGKLRSGIRRLSALEEGPNSREIYEKLADEGVDVHVYGVPDEEPPVDTELFVHGIDDPEIDESRFVTFDGAGEEGYKAAMVAVEVVDGQYRGFWTFEGEFVDEIVDHVESAYSH